MYQVLAVRSPVCLLPLLEVFDLSPSVVIPLYNVAQRIARWNSEQIAQRSIVHFDTLRNDEISVMISKR